MKPERTLVLVASSLLLFWFLWFQWRLILLCFAGLLLAVVLHSAAAWVQRHTPLNTTLAYMSTLVFIIGILVLLGFLLGPRLINQFADIAQALPNSIQNARDYLQRTNWGASLLSLLRRAMQGVDTGAKLTFLAKSVVAGLVDFIVVLVIGFFGALDPRGYREGLLSLVPKNHRGRARRLSTELIGTLRSWMLGQLVPMVALGVASMLALWILGVHLAFALGLFTGLMVFLPYIGTILSSIPAILLALQHSPLTALYVLILYSIFHGIEGYFLTPLVQRRAVRLPPVLTILSQFCLWSFAGILGVAVAAPLTAVGLVLMKNFYPTLNSTS